MDRIDIDVVLQHMSEGFLALDRRGHVVRANAYAGTLLQAAGDLAGMDISRVIPDFAGSPAYEQLSRIAAGSVSRRIQHFAPSRYTWFEALVVPRDGGVYLFVRNVTDQVRQMQSEAVREAVRSIIRDAPIAISITRGPEHRYELLNERSRQLIGGRDVEGSTMRNVFPDLAASPIARIMDDVYQTGVPYTGRNVAISFDRSGKGEVVEGTFDFTYQPLFEPDGSVSGIMSVAVDVTDYLEKRDGGNGR